MLNRISRKISYYLFKDGIIQEGLIDVYTYGFELLLSSFLAIGLVLLLGFILNCFIESSVFLICLVTLRVYTGGYHAKTYNRCNVFLISSFLLCIYVYNAIGLIKIIFAIHIILMLGNFLVAFLFLPIENKNKPFTREEKFRYKKISFFVLLFYYIVAVALETQEINLGFFILVVLEFLLGTTLLELIRRRMVKMQDYLSKFVTSGSKLAIKAAKVAAGNASWWGFFQPQEPEILKQIKEKKMKK